MDTAEPDAPAWIVVNADGKRVAGPYVLRLFAERKASALGLDHSIIPILNIGKSGSAAAWWPI
jgi:hypothetical protein